MNDEVIRAELARLRLLAVPATLEAIDVAIDAAERERGQVGACERERLDVRLAVLRAERDIVVAAREREAEARARSVAERQTADIKRELETRRQAAARLALRVLDDAPDDVVELLERDECAQLFDDALRVGGDGAAVVFVEEAHRANARTNTESVRLRAAISAELAPKVRERGYRDEDGLGQLRALALPPDVAAKLADVCAPDLRARVAARRSDLLAVVFVAPRPPVAVEFVRGR